MWEVVAGGSGGITPIEILKSEMHVGEFLAHLGRNNKHFHDLHFFLSLSSLVSLLTVMYQ